MSFAVKTILPADKNIQTTLSSGVKKMFVCGYPMLKTPLKQAMLATVMYFVLKIVKVFDTQKPGIERTFLDSFRMCSSQCNVSKRYIRSTYCLKLSKGNKVKTD